MRAPPLLFAVLLLVPGAVAAPVAPVPATTVTGTASFYGEAYRGRTTASGLPFDPGAMTAACWHLPLGSRARVTHGERSVVVKITDRGPARRLYREGRVIDLSEAAFARLAPVSLGLIAVTVELEPPAGT